MRWLMLATLVIAIPVNAVSVTDTAQDVEYDAGTLGRTQAPQSYPEADIIEASWTEESATSLQITVQTLGADGTAIVGPQVYAKFSFSDASYRVSWTGSEARLERSAEGSWIEIAILESTSNRTLGSWAATVSKELLEDAHGRRLAAGNTLVELQASTRQETGGPAAVDDTAPSDATLTIESSPHQAGALGVAGVTGRASNGGPDFFIFDLEATNRGNATQDIQMEVVNADEGWELAVPPAMTLGAGASEPLLIAAALPFRHVHGDASSATIRLQGDAGDVLEFPLTVSYVDPADPAGHHSKLYFHAYDTGIATVGTYWKTWASTQDHHPDDTGGTVFSGDGRDSATWTIPIEPDPRVGMIVKPNGEGVLTLRFEPREAFPIPEARVSADLFVCAPGRSDGPFECPGGTLGSTLSGILDLSGTDVTQPFVAEIPLLSTGFSGAFPPHEQFRAQWRIALTGDPWIHIPQTGNAPGIVTGESFAELPLSDYHDSIQPYGPVLSPATIQVAPGGEVWQLLDALDEVDYLLLAPDAPWATIEHHEGASWLVAAPPLGIPGEVPVLLAAMHDKVEAYQTVEIRVVEGTPDDVPKGASIGRQDETGKTTPMGSLALPAALLLLVRAARRKARLM